jgi:hypothetical protein
VGDDDSSGVGKKPIKAFDRFRFLVSVHTHSLRFESNDARSPCLPQDQSQTAFAVHDNPSQGKPEWPFSLKSGFSPRLRWQLSPPI